MKAQFKVPDQVVKTGEGSIRYRAIENDLHLQFPLRFEIQNRTVGALVLSKDEKLERVRFVFGFDCAGVHTTLRQDEQETTFEGIESGLKDLPQGEALKIHFGSFTSDASRQAQLKQLFDQADAPQLKYLLEGERMRVSELTRMGIRKPKFLRLYCTYTVEPAHAGASDQIEKTINVLRENWLKYTNQFEEMERLRLETLFYQAFTDGFQIWEQLLSNKMGLQVRPMTDVELWKDCWNRINPSEPQPQPQEIILSEAGLLEQIHSRKHPTSCLIDRQEDCPFADRKWVKVKGKYVGVMQFDSKPAGWKDINDQLRYLWDIIKRDHVFDTEIITELTLANERQVKTDMQRLTKQSVVAADFASSKSSIDVAASLKARKGVAAQESLYEGSVPLNVATVVLVHRATPERLSEACRYLQSCIRRPAVLDREVEYAWRTWVQTLPISWEPLLLKPHNKRLLYLTSEAPAFMSLVRPRQGDKSGLELLSDEGGVPVMLDCFNQHRNLAIFGTTRSGKSVLISGLLTQALAQKVPVVALDFPKPDGTSTFTDYTLFMGKHGAYFDIGSESNNLFELPDLRSLSPQEQHERFEDYKSFLEGALITMIMGDEVNPMKRNAIRSLIVILLGRFYADPQIMARYGAAIEGGFGSPQWQQTPTLNDFLGFCSLEQVSHFIPEITQEQKEALGQIQLQLRFWCTSRVGKAISAPSSFPTDARLLVFALRNLNDEADAAVLALSAYSAALRRALASPKSVFFIDESPILFEYREISSLVARLCANGAKAGIRVFLSAQDPDTIAKAPAAAKILQNLSTRLIGRIQPTAVNSFVKYLSYEPEIISRNATESFFPKREGIYSQWLLDDNGIKTFVRFYVNFRQLAIVANNTDEQASRTSFMKAIANPYQAIDAFAKELVGSIRDNRTIRNIDGTGLVAASSPSDPSLSASGTRSVQVL